MNANAAMNATTFSADSRPLTDAEILALYNADSNYVPGEERWPLWIGFSIAATFSGACWFGIIKLGHYVLPLLFR